MRRATSLEPVKLVDVAKRGVPLVTTPTRDKRLSNSNVSAARVVAFLFYAACSLLCFLAGRNTCFLWSLPWDSRAADKTDTPSARDGNELYMLHEEIIQLEVELQDALLRKHERQVMQPQPVLQDDDRVHAEVVVGVLVNKGELQQLEELLTGLMHPQIAVLVHLDSTASILEKQRLPELLSKFRRKPKTFASIGQLQNATASPDLSLLAVDVTLRTIEQFVDTIKDWRFYVNLSAKDIPLLRPEELLSLLQTAPPDANFIDIHFESHFDLIFERVTRLAVENGVHRSSSLSLPTKGGKPYQRKFPTLFDPYYGEGGVTLSAEFARYLTTTTDGFPRRLFAYYANVESPEEGFFQTLLCASDLEASLVADNLRAAGASASTADVPNILSSGALFVSDVSDGETRELLLARLQRAEVDLHGFRPRAALDYAQARMQAAVYKNQTCGAFVRGTEELAERIRMARKWEPALKP